MRTLEATANLFIHIVTKKVTENDAPFAIWLDVQQNFDYHTQDVIKNMVWPCVWRSWSKGFDSGKVTAPWRGSSLHYREVMASVFLKISVEAWGNRFVYWERGVSAMELRDVTPNILTAFATDYYIVTFLGICFSLDHLKRSRI
jgi:hypothetical protein